MNQTPERQSATGLDFLRNAMASGGLGKGIGQTLGLSIDAVDDGHVTLSGAPGLEHANPMGAVHGGYLATLLDGAMERWRWPCRRSSTSARAMRPRT